MNLQTITTHELESRFLYVGKNGSYVAVLAPTYAAHWITALHQFIDAAKQEERRECNT